jgi:CRP/FNR family cyclic AMP-dependent transcriptional regulator
MSRFIQVEFQPGERLFSAGDFADRLFILQQGYIDLLEPRTGEPFARLVPGESFGEQAMLVGGVRSATAVAVDHVICQEITAEGLQQLLSREKDFTRNIFEALLMQLYMNNALRSA